MADMAGGSEMIVPATIMANNGVVRKILMSGGFAASER